MVQADQLSFKAADAKKVCIIDAGYDISHEDLQKNLVAGVDLTTTQIGDWNTDENSHGTHVAGTVAGLGGNGVGVVGVVPTGTLPLFIAKVFDASGSATSSAIVNGVRQCSRAGAKIISMSLGGGRPTKFEERTYQRMADKGILVIAAAGNAGDTSTSFPAGYPSVMSVAAIDVNMAKADFSQSNADVEISAPGVDTLSTVPPNIASLATLTVGAGSYAVQVMDGSPRSSATGALADFGFGETPAAGSMAGKVCLISRGNIDFATKVQNCQASGGVGAVVYNNVPGELFGTLGGVATTIPSVGATQADGAAMLAQAGTSATVAVSADPSKYASFNGTSMATPHVSGVAALVWSNHPTCSAAQIRSTLQKSAMDLGAAGRDNDFGFGLVQAKAAFDRIATLGCGN
jgi:subtilisin family serine protease